MQTDDVFLPRGSFRVCLYALVFFLVLELSLNVLVHTKAFKMLKTYDFFERWNISRFSITVNSSSPCWWMQNATIKDVRKIQDSGCKPVRNCSISPPDLGRYKLYQMEQDYTSYKRI